MPLGVQRCEAVANVKQNRLIRLILNEQSACEPRFPAGSMALQ